MPANIPFRFVEGLPRNAQYQLWRDFEALAQQIGNAQAGRKLVGPKTFSGSQFETPLLGGSGLTPPWGTLPAQALVATTLFIVGVRTGGMIGSTADGVLAFLNVVFKNVGGTHTRIGSGGAGVFNDAVPGWNVYHEFTGSTFQITVDTPNLNSTWWIVCDYMVLDTSGAIVEVTL